MIFVSAASFLLRFRLDGVQCSRRGSWSTWKRASSAAPQLSSFVSLHQLHAFHAHKSQRGRISGSASISRCRPIIDLPTIELHFLVEWECFKFLCGKLHYLLMSFEVSLMRIISQRKTQPSHHCWMSLGFREDYWTPLKIPIIPISLDLYMEMPSLQTSHFPLLQLTKHYHGCNRRNNS